jgi:uncharacterized protein (DUF4415 family)
MASEERIVRYTADELAAMRARGEGQTDWARVKALTDEEIEASIDHEDEGEFDWSVAYVGIPHPNKKQLTVRLDPDIVQWFKDHGPGYQTRMNAVLRSYVDAQKRRTAKI